MGRVVCQPTETHLGVAELALDHPERMFNLGARLGLGLLDLANHATEQAALAERLVGTAASGNRPDDFTAFMLGTLFDAGITGVSADIRLFAVQQLST